MGLANGAMLDANKCYGTLLMALEQGQVVKLARSAHSFAAWLREHGEVEIITHDRCGLYADGGCETQQPARERIGLELVAALDLKRGETTENEPPAPTDAQWGGENANPPQKREKPV